MRAVAVTPALYAIGHDRHLARKIAEAGRDGFLMAQHVSAIARRERVEIGKSGRHSHVPDFRFAS